MTLPYPPPPPTPGGGRARQSNAQFKQLAVAMATLALLAIAIWLYLRWVTPVRLVYLGYEGPAGAIMATVEDVESDQRDAADDAGSEDAPCKRTTTEDATPSIEITSRDPVKLRVAGCNIRDERVQTRLKWSTGAAETASVSKGGLVTCKASGAATMSARVADGGADAPEIEIPVLCNLVSKLRLNLPSRLEMHADAALFKAEALNERGTPIDSVRPTVENLSPDLLEISGDSYRPLHEGRARVRVKWGSLAEESTVEVFNAEALVRSFRPTYTPSVYAGSTPQPFRVDAQGIDGLPVPDVAVSLDIDDTSIAEVIAGVLVPKKAGTVRIEAHVGNQSAVYEVNVYERLVVIVTTTNAYVSNGRELPWDAGWGGEPDLIVKLNEQALGMESAPSDTVCDDDRTCRFAADTTEPDGRLRFEILDEDVGSVERIANLTCQLNGRSSTTCSSDYASVTIERATR